MYGRFHDQPKNPEAEAQAIIREKYQRTSGPDVYCTICNEKLKPRFYTMAGEQKQFGHHGCECAGLKAVYKSILAEEEQKVRDFMIETNRRILEERIYRSGLGARFSERTFENYHAETEWQENALAVTKDFVQKMIARTAKGQGLILSGGVGTGKTHLAAAASIELMNAGFETVYGTATSILGAIKKGWKSDSDDVVARYCRVPVLVIDDLGKEYSRKTDGWSWAQEQFFEVINARYENYLPMIITTNFSMSQLSEAMGDAIVSRLVECCRGVRCDGEDYRMRRAKK